MSFSIKIKEEVARQDYNQEEKKAVFSAIAKINGTLKMTNNGLILEIRTENAKIAKLLFLINKDLYNDDARLLVSKKKKLKKNSVYLVQIRKDVIIKMEQLSIYKDGMLDVLPTKKLLKDLNILKAYLSGCFLSSGSVTSPLSKNYHLEISTNSLKHSRFIAKSINKFQLNAKVIKRRNDYVVYLKKSEEISDFLKLINAPNGLMIFEEERISKDYWNSNNRLNTCEVNNEVKILETANKQIELIKLIFEEKKEYLLDEKDKKIANIRLENPEASLQEIADIYIAETEVNISKSGINHRFMKIREIASQIKVK